MPPERSRLSGAFPHTRPHGRHEDEERPGDLLSRLDLVFCVDLTSSMTSFIAQARAHVRRILEALSAVPNLDLCVARVGYRDHGFHNLLELHPFTRDIASLAQALEQAQVVSHPSNTDASEAVFAALDAALRLPWREGAFRVAVLVGDAPPHACGADGGVYPDRFRDRDPSGWDLDGLTNQLESDGIFLHALARLRQRRLLPAGVESPLTPSCGPHGSRPWGPPARGCATGSRCALRSPRESGARPPARRQSHRGSARHGSVRLPGTPRCPGAP